MVFTSPAAVRVPRPALEPALRRVLGGRPDRESCPPTGRECSVYNTNATTTGTGRAGEPVGPFPPRKVRTWI